MRYRAQRLSRRAWTSRRPNGSHDAFYIKIDKHYGSSDHVTYMQHGIPAVMFITWPDMWYHSSQDTPDKQDSTQYKRAAVVGIGALAVLATGGDEMAGRVTTENLGARHRAHGRLRAEGRRATWPTPRRPTRCGRRGRMHASSIRHQADVEKAVIRSSGVLYPDPAAAATRLAAVEAAIDKKASALVDEARAAYALHAQRLNAPPVVDSPPTPEEKEAVVARGRMRQRRNAIRLGAAGARRRTRRPAAEGPVPAAVEGAGGCRAIAASTHECRARRFCWERK